MVRIGRSNVDIGVAAVVWHFIPKLAMLSFLTVTLLLGVSQVWAAALRPASAYRHHCRTYPHHESLKSTEKESFMVVG